MLDHIGRTEMCDTLPGTRGELPSSGYNIHCPLMGGDSQTFNYLLSSCRSRQASRGCSERTCPRFAAKAPVRQHRLQSPPPSPPQKDKPAKPAQRRVARPSIKRVTAAPLPPAFDPAVFRQNGGIQVTLVIPDAQSHLYQVLVNAAKRHQRSLSDEILVRLTRRLK
jgi:hypothetical protein